MTVGDRNINWRALVPFAMITRVGVDQIDRLTAHPGGSGNVRVWGSEKGVRETHIIYSTTSVLGGTLHGKYIVLVLANHNGTWENLYQRTFLKRHLAKKRALQLYADHNPIWGSRNGY